MLIRGLIIAIVRLKSTEVHCEGISVVTQEWRVNVPRENTPSKHII